MKNKLFIIFIIFINNKSLGQFISRKIEMNDSIMFNKNTYFLPKTLLSLEFTYVLVTYRHVIVQKGQIDQVSGNENFKSLSIDEGISLKQQYYPDYNNKFELVSLNKRASNYEHTVEFTKDGMIKSINGKNESIIPDLILAAGTTVSTAIKVISTIKMPIGPGMTEEDQKNIPETRLEEITRKIPYKTAIDNINQLLDIKYGYSISDFANNTIKISNFLSTNIPMVNIKITPLAPAILKDHKKISNIEIPGIIYRKPFICSVQSSIINNGTIPKQVISLEYFNFPQFGDLAIANVMKKNKNEEIEFIFSEGTLTKYTYKKKTDLKKSLESINKAASDINDQIKQMKDEAKKNAEQNNETNILKNQINILKLEKELLELQKP